MNATHIETDALAGLRDELVNAARRTRVRRQRRRRSAVLLAAALVLLALAAGAAAVANFSTGVPAVDELLDRELPEDAPDPRRLDVRPGAGPASEPLAVRMGDGTFDTLAYLTRDGNICTASADRHRGSVRGGGGCVGTVDDVNRALDRRGATWAGSAIGADHRVNQYLVEGAVESVRPLGEGDWTVQMTEPWTASADGARAVRLVVVTDEADMGNPDDGLQPGELPPEAFAEPTLELTYEDGRTSVYEGRQAK